MEGVKDVSLDQICILLKKFSGRTYSSKFSDAKDEKIVDLCIELWKLDYNCEIVENLNGSLCSTYPSRIIVPVQEINFEGEKENPSPISSAVIIKAKLNSNNDKQTSSISSQWNIVNGSNPSGLCVKFSKASLSQSTKEETANFYTQPSINLGVDNPIETPKDKLNLGDVMHQSEDSQDCSDSCTPETLCSDKELKKQSPIVSFSLDDSCKTDDSESLKDSTSPSTPQKFTLRDYFSRANLARCRYRFPIPAILCKGKYVSRSATLSCFIDVIGKQILHSSEPEIDIESKYDSMLPKHSNDLDRARYYDIKLLEAIGISAIIDLMVENKKVKYNVNVSSSEKADKENRYSKFSITSIPYPGCEFFREFTDQKFNSSKLFYNWDQPFNDACLSHAEDNIPTKVSSDWINYKNWDLRKMTETYLKLILRYILDEDSAETGFLLHCISGWDRTPLFVSLVRLSLWADGTIHSSLDSKQMLFFTLAYDWYLFGHQFPDRLKSKENILYFCFEFLQEIYKDTFMDFINDKRGRHPSTSSFVAFEADTSMNSFGSATSLNSSIASAGTSRESPLRQSEPTDDRSDWPYNKENGFSFDGIKDFDDSGASQARSPLKERNKAGATTSRGGTAKGTSNTDRMRKSGNIGTFHGVLRDLSSSRRRKNSASDSAPQPRTHLPSQSSDESVPESDAASGFRVIERSKPVPVPSSRSRHNSTSSSVGSWQLLSASDPYKEITVGCDSTSHRASRTSLPAEMVDSVLTIQEEATPSSSLESTRSFIVFNRQRRLSEVREMFFRAYRQEISSIYPECSFITDFVQNICQKLGS